MSTNKGSITRTRAQMHQNRTAFKNDLHATPQRKFINSLQVCGVCNKCKAKIEWRIKYKKYKLLTAPKKCIKCEQKSVKYAYHTLCTPCAESDGVCAKCRKKEEVIPAVQTASQDVELQAILKGLSERKRRTLLRYLQKKEENKCKQDKDSTETVDDSEEYSARLEKLKLSIKNNQDQEDLDFNDDDFTDSNISDDDSDE